MSLKQLKIIKESGEYDDLLLADGFEEAFIGLSQSQPNRPVCAVYDADKCIKILKRRDKMTYDEALDFFAYNVLGSYVGWTTPLFISSNII